jgi:hypothetical protein
MELYGKNQMTSLFIHFDCSYKVFVCVRAWMEIALRLRNMRDAKEVLNSRVLRNATVLGVKTSET